MLSVVIPTYNEATHIGRTINGLKNMLEQYGIDCELIIVDDGSIDNTLEQALSAAQGSNWVKVLSYKKNRGKGYALNYGLRFARGDAVLFLDADPHVDVEVIPEYLTYLGNDNDLVIANRRLPGARIVVGQPPAHKFFSKLFNIAFRMLFYGDIRHYRRSTGLRPKLTDTQCGLKIFRRAVAEDILSTVKAEHFAYDAEVIALALKRDYRLAELPVIWEWPGGRNVTILHRLGMFVDLFKMWHRLRHLSSHRAKAITA